jgi:hypothetical protein
MHVPDGRQFPSGRDPLRDHRADGRDTAQRVSNNDGHIVNFHGDNIESCRIFDSWPAWTEVIARGDGEEDGRSHCQDRQVLWQM